MCGTTIANYRQREDSMKTEILLILVILTTVVRAYRLEDLYFEYLNFDFIYSNESGALSSDSVGEIDYRSNQFQISVVRDLKRVNWWGTISGASYTTGDVNEFGVNDIELGIGLYLKRSKYGTRWQIFGELGMPVSDPSSGYVLSSARLIPVEDSTEFGGFTSGDLAYSLGTKFKHTIFPLQPFPTEMDIAFSILFPSNESLDMWFLLDSKFSFIRWKNITPYISMESWFSRNAKSVGAVPLISSGIGISLFGDRRVSVRSQIMWGLTSSSVSRSRENSDGIYHQFSQDFPSAYTFDLSISYSIPTRGDDDFDSVPDKLDNCIYIAEDRDGYFDHDGCPDYDNDLDEIPDSLDYCPNDPEDFDQFEDHDGCPELDNDADMFIDEEDSCPNIPEDYDLFEDGDGCPEFDNDDDLVADSVDSCPNTPEDFDQFEDDDGCPELDNDLDGIDDSMDLCPLLEETYNEILDEDGCPDVQPRKGELVVQGAVYFESDSYSITSRDSIFITGLIETIDPNSLIKIEIIGHTDSTADASYNNELGSKRVESVATVFSDSDLPQNMIIKVSRGEDNPFSLFSNADGMALNRRVIIHIWMELENE